jgi:hypothetical protein
MPRDMHASAGRVRSRSESRAAAATRPSPDPGSESDTDADSELAAQDPRSDSGSEAGRSGSGPGPPHSLGRVLHLCVGCGKSFDSETSLRRHRNNHWMTDPACRNSGLKRPKLVRAAGAGVSSRDADALIRHTMGDSRPPPGAAQNPPLQPRNKVCSPNSSQTKVCTRFARGSCVVCTIWFALYFNSLHTVCNVC